MNAITSLASTITDRVASQGFYYHQEELSLDEFYEVAEMLGETVRLDDVELNDCPTIQFGKPAGIFWHNDGDIDIVGWNCVRQESSGGDLLLTDLRQVVSEMEPSDVEILKQTPSLCPWLSVPERKVPKRIPVISELEDTLWVNYKPRQIRPQSEAQAAAFETLKQKVDARGDGCYSVPIQPRESLFVDNRRVLHCRDAISKGSTRLLKRVLVVTDNPFNKLYGE
ncbi:MAG: hypothetical protein CMJ81_24525 [Planctomycetaceae bacterium]|jgi:hypothetical protein|nr:hypothetical protein [Planctomycetaceae bacterium]MBP60722.1 hypothetical protein [Planctomycetaceae bacterium]